MPARTEPADAPIDRAPRRWRTPSRAQLRQCAKVALAAMAAYGLTLGERNEYALFSVLGAALIVGGSLGETLEASLNRVFGTLAGAVVGVAAAAAFGMSFWSLGLAVAALAWLNAGFGWGPGAFRVGAAMALVVLLTRADDALEYGAWRVLNTMFGIAIGLVVSRVVWPVRSREEITAASARCLSAAAAVLHALSRGQDTAGLIPRQLELLDALTALRAARAHSLLEHRIERGASLLPDLVRHTARVAVATLGTSQMMVEFTSADSRPLAAEALRAALAALAVNADRGAPPVDTQPLRERALQAAASLDADGRSQLHGLLEQLRQIDVALETLRPLRSP